MIQGTFEEESAEYREFVEKFKPKKTTDDCYTPENVYKVVLEWAARRYGFDPGAAVRPFWPGGDYERFDYPDGCVVVDNPPFSILAKIIRFYIAHGIEFFLFAPALTLFSCYSPKTKYVPTGAQIIYENGAGVNTSFVTSLGENLIETAPDLTAAIKAECDKNRHEKAQELRKLSFPDAIVTAARLQWLSIHGVKFAIKKKDAMFIRKSDNGGSVFGGGFLLSERAAAERAAAERAAAERAAAHKIELSDREKQLQKMLGEK